MKLSFQTLWWQHSNLKISRKASIKCVNLRVTDHIIWKLCYLIMAIYPSHNYIYPAYKTRKKIMKLCFWHQSTNVVHKKVWIVVTRMSFKRTIKIYCKRSTYCSEFLSKVHIGIEINCVLLLQICLRIWGSYGKYWK